MNHVQSVRVRFAPSPTGTMHLGNVRAALLNYLFARKKKGTFIIRIEDTDPERNVDVGGKQILTDLTWLGLSYDEGPFFQSERTAIYQEYLEKLQKIGRVYRCFCTTELLEKKRERQVALKQPPRYDRTCLQLDESAIAQNIAARVPFIWRFKLEDEEIVVTDLARGTIDYAMKNFSDCPLTRQDGSFTFVFANFVDDLTMQISHIFRGEEHISSTALQAAMYKALQHPIPIFWHFPLICNIEGKKLSKRDFGFSLHDLQKEGFLPEAVINYLAIIGASFEHEIMSLEELVHAVDIEKSASAGFIRYDVEKLRWINHKWLLLLPTQEIAKRCQPFLIEKYPSAAKLTTIEIDRLIEPLRDEGATLHEIVHELAFYFERPTISKELLEQHQYQIYRPILQEIIGERRELENPDDFFAVLSLICKERNLKPKDLYALIRIALTGKPQGLGLKELLHILPRKERHARLEALLHNNA